MKRIGVALALVLLVGGLAYAAWAHYWQDGSQRSDLGMVISHKTAGLEYPENSPEGFKESLKMGVDAIEIDVHMVRGGRFVLHHDPVLSDYNCYDKNDDTRLIVAQQTVEQLAALDCSNYKVDETGKKYAIVTLDEFLTIYRDSDQSKKLLLEIKVWDELIENNPDYEGLDISAMHYPDEEVVRGIYATLRKFPDVTNIQFNTFSRELLLALRDEMRPEENYDFGLLYKGSYGPVRMAIPALIKNRDCYDLCWVPDYREVRKWLDDNDIRTFIPNFAQASSVLFRLNFEWHIMRDKGDLTVIPWTLNTEEEWMEFAQQNYDGVLTDKPTEFLKWAAQQQ